MYINHGLSHNIIIVLLVSKTRYKTELHLSKLVFILFSEAVSSREEIPASLLVHLPHIWFLSNTHAYPICLNNSSLLLWWGVNIVTCLTCPVCSVSSLLIKYIRKNLVKRETLVLFVWRWRDCITSERCHKTELLTCNWPSCVLQAYGSQSHVELYQNNHSQYHI